MNSEGFMQRELTFRGIADRLRNVVPNAVDVFIPALHNTLLRDRGCGNRHEEDGHNGEELELHLEGY